MGRLDEMADAACWQALILRRAFAPKGKKTEYEQETRDFVRELLKRDVTARKKRRNAA